MVTGTCSEVAGADKASRLAFRDWDDCWNGREGFVGSRLTLLQPEQARKRGL